eukprot:5239587-Pyramimonas_sp.AAC.1
MIYMRGAASSHTRGGNHDFTCDPYCPCCGEAFWPSVRHCVTECAAFADSESSCLSSTVCP